MCLVKYYKVNVYIVEFNGCCFKFEFNNVIFKLFGTKLFNVLLLLDVLNILEIEKHTTCC